MLGPMGGATTTATVVVPIAYSGSEVARLEVGGPEADAEELAFLDRVAVFVWPHCRAARDAGGARRQP